MNEPLISVIIPTCNRADILAECLNALSAQTLPARFFEVLVCDDGSVDSTQEVLEAYAAPFPLRTFRQQNAGPAAARNHCLRHARGRLVLILNDDAVAAPNLLERHLAAHEKLGDGNFAVLGTFSFPEEIVNSPLRWLLENSHFVFQYHGMEPETFQDYSRFWTCNVSLPRAGVEAAGYFDEDFKEAAFEDLDFGYRLLGHGYRLYYDPSCRTEHHHVITVHDFLRRQLAIGRNAILMARKHPELTERITGFTDLQTARKRVIRMLAKSERVCLDALREVLALEGGHSGECSAGSLSETAAKMEQPMTLANAYWIYLGFLQGFSCHSAPSRLRKGKSLRLTILSPGLSISGGMKVIVRYCNLLAARGHHVTLVHLKGNGRSLFELHPRVKRVTWDLRAKKLVSTLPDADALLATQWATAYPVARMPCNKGTKFYLVQDYESTTIGTPDECDPTYLLPLQRITVSNWLKNVIRTRFGGQTSCIVNGIDSEYLYPEPEIRLRHPAEDFRVGMLYHREERKGVRDAMEAIRIVRQFIPNTRVIAFSALLPVEFPYDEFHYRITGNRVREFFNTLDVYLSSSWQEGFGLPGLEAMACGVPLVTTDSGGVREYAIPGETALVVPPRDPRALADALLRVASDKALRGHLSEAGHAMSGQFRWEDAADQMEQLLLDACS